MMLRTVIYALLLATLCVGCGGRISMRQLQEFYSDTCSWYLYQGWAEDCCQLTGIF